MIWQKFLTYITFSRNKTVDGKPNFSLRMMHGINRISILMFLIAIIILLVRHLF